MHLSRLLYSCFYADTKSKVHMTMNIQPLWNTWVQLFEIHDKWLVQAYRHNAQCSVASVGFAQACPNNFSQYSIMKCHFDLFHVQATCDSCWRNLAVLIVILLAVMACNAMWFMLNSEHLKIETLMHTLTQLYRFTYVQNTMF